MKFLRTGACWVLHENRLHIGRVYLRDDRPFLAFILGQKICYLALSGLDGTKFKIMFIGRPPASRVKDMKERGCTQCGVGLIHKLSGKCNACEQSYIQEGNVKRTLKF